MSSQWHYTEKGQQRGPISAEELKSRASSKTLDPDDLVWKEGMAEWLPARKIKGLFATPPATTESPPPPLPSTEVGTKSSGVLDALKTTGRLAAKQAERTRLVKISLAGAYHRLGKAIVDSNVGRSKFAQQLSALDALKCQMTAVPPPVEPEAQPQGLVQQAKTMAKATADAAQRKVAKTRFDHALVTLGKAAFEKRNELSLPQQEVGVIESLLQQVESIDAEIHQLSADKPGQSLVDATLRSTRHVGWSLIDNRIVHTVLAVGCFPFGLFLIWRSQLWSKRAKLIWTGAVAALAIAGIYNSVVETRAMNASLTQAKTAWDSGKEVDAVDLYRALLEDHWFRLEDADRATLIRRTAEFDLNHGNEEAARKLLEGAAKQKPVVSFSDPKAQSLWTQVNNDMELRRTDLPEYITLLDGSKCLTKNATESELLHALIRPGTYPERVKAVFGEPTSIRPEKGTLIWFYRTEFHKIMIVFGSSGPYANRVGIVVLDDTMLFAGDEDFRH